MTDDCLRIFLHYGPGCHPKVEEKLLVGNWQFICQKKVSECDFEMNKSYISHLVEQHQFILESFAEGRQEVKIVAHSFGAYLLNLLPLSLLREFKEIHLLTPTFDFFRSITNMFEAVIDTDDQASLKSLREDKSSEEFWRFFNHFSEKYPNYFSSYFHSKEKLKSYLDVASEFVEMDMESTVAAVNEMFLKSSEINLDGLSNVVVHLGENDPLIPKPYQEELKRQLPYSQFLFYDTGHFPHIEKTILF